VPAKSAYRNNKKYSILEQMAKRKRRPEKFSIVKAVKANARDRVGQPRPERVILDDQKRENSRKAKHRQTMPQLLIGE
jgi:hypothetical protein